MTSPVLSIFDHLQTINGLMSTEYTDSVNTADNRGGRKRMLKFFYDKVEYLL